MGDRDDLTFALSHLLHDVGHLLGYLAADARVYLVEDDGRQLHGTANHGFQRQHNTGNLTTRRHLSHRLQRRRRIGREEECHLILSTLAKLAPAHAHLEAHVRHAQRHQPLPEFLFYLAGSLLAHGCQFVGLLPA